MDEETKGLIDGLERRLQEVEKKLEGKHARKIAEHEGEKDYSGLKGGITLLVDEHFFDVPKALDETIKQLAVKGYHHQNGAVQAALARDFMKKKRILTRITEENKYKYVIRK
jgi:hypothetical protein